MEMARLGDAAWIFSVVVNAKSGINRTAGRGGILMIMDGLNRHHWRPDYVAILQFYSHF
jgi:hypothetical protein